MTDAGEPNETTPPPLPPVPMPGAGDAPKAIETSPPPLVTPGLDPGAEPSGDATDPEPPATEHLVLGSSPRMTAVGEQAPPTPTRRRFRWGRALLLCLVLLILFPPASVLVTQLVAPPVTILLLERFSHGRPLVKEWRSLDRIAPSLQTAVIAAEDDGFCSHKGFDWAAIRIAAEHNARSPNKVRGGSTISQQTAKNVFLWPSRDYVRKGLEAGYTVLIEAIWGKRRILETYLNVVEWGPGLYGAQAAARQYFHEDADRLTPQQSARLAAILPSPLKWRAVNPGRYVTRRSRSIAGNAQLVREDDLAWCLRR
ncbi:hypothetical protein BH09PSE2_BH09PSE2_05520 [soil metagenome]